MRAETDIYECIWVKILNGGLGVIFPFSSVKVCSPAVSASSVLDLYVCGYCPSGTSENVSRLIHQVFYCTDIRKCLHACIQVNFAS